MSEKDKKSGVYLLQPSVLRDTNIYKFGMSNDLDKRVTDYGKLRKLVYKFYTNNPDFIEEIFKKIFNDYIYDGNEYILYENLIELKYKVLRVINLINKLYKFINYCFTKSNINNKIVYYSYNKKDISIILNELKNYIIKLKKENQKLKEKQKNNKMKEKQVQKQKKIIKDLLDPKKNKINNESYYKEYICVRCGVSFKNNKACLRNHFYRKNECKKIYDNMSYNDLILLLECDEYINYYNTLNRWE